MVGGMNKGKMVSRVGRPRNQISWGIFMERIAVFLLNKGPCPSWR
jgi:hypothetical protein